MKNFRKSIYRISNPSVIPPSECKSANVTISSTDAEASDDGTVWMDYTNCDGDIVSLQYADAGYYPNSVCVDPETAEAFYYYVGGVATNAGSCELFITGTNCGDVVFAIDSTVKDVNGQGTLDIIGGEPGETIDLSFVMTYDVGDFNSLNFSAPVTVLVLDPLHDTRTGTMVLDGSGNGSSTYDFDPITSAASCLVTITARSSGNPVGIGDDTNII